MYLLHYYTKEKSGKILKKKYEETRMKKVIKVILIIVVIAGIGNILFSKDVNIVDYSDPGYDLAL